MGKADISIRHRSMSSEDQRAFDRWLKANSILGMIFAVVFVAMAVAGWMAESPPGPAIADSRVPANTAARIPSKLT
jgi:hypothetical protein